MSEKLKEAIKYTGILREDGRVYVDDPRALDFFISRGYGIREGEGFILDPTEVLYLAYKGILEVSTGEGRIIPLQELLEMYSAGDPAIWVRLNIYTDLRKRGFTVRPGIGSSLSFFAEKRVGETVKRYLVEGLREGIRIGFMELERMFRRAIESSRILVVAVVDKEGNISYYTVERISSVERYGEG